MTDEELSILMPLPSSVSTAELIDLLVDVARLYGVGSKDAPQLALKFFVALKTRATEEELKTNDGPEVVQ
jgi:hypothetical protein